MDKIVELSKEEPVVSHKLIAKSTNNEEVSIRNLINKYKEQFEQFGGCPHFKNEGDNEVAQKQKDNPNYRPSKTYYLNEQQATFLMTLLRNSDKVVNFKMKLVKEFYNMRSKLLEYEANKKILKLDGVKAPLIDMFKDDFKQSFTKVLGQQRTDAVYKRVLEHEPVDHNYEFVTGISKRWFTRGNKIYVQASLGDGTYKRYSTKLKTTDENIKWIDTDDNAINEFNRIHNDKMGKL
jgi:phage regulator Rha-like protein